MFCRQNHESRAVSENPPGCTKNLFVMKILAIETSCDETALAIIESEGVLPDLRFRIHADKVLSQIDIHKEYGGVFPMLAKREHARTLVPLLIQTLKDAGMHKKTSRHVVEHPLRPEFQVILEREPELFGQFLNELPSIDVPDIDAIAVTQGPGLEPALWVGINFAKALSLIWKKPIIPVNHMEGHFLAALLNTEDDVVKLAPIKFPALGLLVSGGHTELVLMNDWGKYELIGETKDDAVGEAFDKVARVLGLPYPGGPEISRLGETGTPGQYTLPRPMLHSGDYNFSFAGLKTAVLYLAKKLGALSATQKADIAREFEEACVEVLVKKTLRAIDQFGAKTVILGGGVSANKRLRNTLTEEIAKLHDVACFLPTHELATDNALMIGIAAQVNHQGDFIKLEDLKARGNWHLTS